MRPQIYDATTELGDKNMFRNQPSHRKSRRRSSKRFRRTTPRNTPNNMFKVIIYTRNKSQDAEFDGAGYQEVGLG